MAIKEKTPRSWEIDDFLDLGARGGKTYMKAIPILFLEKWILGNKQEGIANFCQTKDIALRLQASGLVSGFKPKGTSNVCSAFVKMQNARNLTNPPLINHEGGGRFYINLPRYETLLQNYQQIFYDKYPNLFSMLFHNKEPEWEQHKSSIEKVVESKDLTMTKTKEAPRSWEIDDLLYIGVKGGKMYMKALPILFLEKWLNGNRKEGEANYHKTKEIAKRLQNSDLVDGFKPRGSSTVCSALVRMQNARNLTNPPLIRHEGGGKFYINLPRYEPLLYEYQKIFYDKYPNVYSKLFPKKEPEWEKAMLSKIEKADSKDEITKLLTPLENSLRNKQLIIDKLNEENIKLKSELNFIKTAVSTISDVELKHDCEEFLKREDTLIDAVRRAGVVLETRIKSVIGGEGPEKFKTGVDLVEYAFTPKSGMLTIRDHPAEQDGVKLLFKGAFQFVRNPPSHKKIQYSEIEARQTVTLIDYLLSLLRQAKKNIK